MCIFINAIRKKFSSTLIEFLIFHKAFSGRKYVYLFWILQQESSVNYRKTPLHFTRKSFN